METAVSVKEAFSLGLPVEVENIDKELGRLWEESGDNQTRASHINLVVYTEDWSAMEHNTEIIRQIAENHACRAILICAEPASKVDKVQAWINAHCHTFHSENRTVCSEQITFRMEGDTVNTLPNIVFSHLDSDLPLYFWWQGEFPLNFKSELWSWIDRLIFDSHLWKIPTNHFDLLSKIQDEASERIILCDLTWTRLLGSRFALAQIFDHQGALAELGKITEVTIQHAPHHRTTACFMLGWLAAQLDWELHSILGKHSFRSKDGREILVNLKEQEGACISLYHLASPDASFELQREVGSDFFHATIKLPDRVPVEVALKADRERITDTLLQEIVRGGKHPLYLKALKKIGPLFH
ncbi:MAG: glucose-6-phosphate dehydrogenase assembly protein OpcA [Chthoniobacterales bacterium]